MTNTHKWDIIIDPTRPWWKLGIKDIWHYRDLYVLFVKREIVTTYKQTILGPLWFFLQPALTTAIYTLVFGTIAKLNPEGIPAPLFFVCGVVIWNFFSESLTGTANTFQQNASIYGKVYFPRVISPLAKASSGLLRFGIQFLLVIFMALYYIISGQFHFVFALSIFWVLPLVLLMLFLGLGLGMIISALTTKYRDLSYLLSFGIQLLMYGSAVVYTIDSLPVDGIFYQLVKWNPLAQIVDSFRHAILGQSIQNYEMLLYSTACVVLAMLLGVFIFNKVEKSFIDVV